MKLPISVIKLYPSLLLLTLGGLIFGGALIYKSTPNKYIITKTETVYKETDPNHIFRENFEVKVKEGHVYSWGEVDSYDLYIKGSKRYEVAVMSLKSVGGIIKELKSSTIVIRVDSDEVMEAINYIRNLHDI